MSSSFTWIAMVSPICSPCTPHLPPIHSPYSSQSSLKMKSRSCPLLLEIPLVTFHYSIWSGFNLPLSSLLILLSCMLSLFSHVWLFAIQWTVAHQAHLSLGFSRQEYWSGLPCPSSGDLPKPGRKPGLSTLQADSLQLSYQGISSW